jgi:hypothetical protein
MGDQDLRQFERQFTESGAVEDGAAWLRERVRAGSLSNRAVRLAAYLGSEIATAYLGDAAGRLSPMQRQSTKVWIDGMLSIGKDAPWEADLRRQITIAGASICVPLWAKDVSAAVRKQGKLSTAYVQLLDEIGAASEGLPAKEAVGKTREAFEALQQRLDTQLEGEEQSRTRYSDDDVEDGIMRKHMEDDSAASELDLSSTMRFRLDDLEKALRGEEASPHDVIKVLGFTEFRDHLEAAARRALAEALTAWLLGSDAPSPSGESDMGPVSTSNAPTDDGELVAALKALTLTSPAKRMFIADLERRLNGGGSLSDGQRTRAQDLHDEHA